MAAGQFVLAGRPASLAWRARGSTLSAQTTKRNASILVAGRAELRRTQPRSFTNTFKPSRTVATYSTPAEKFKAQLLKARRENPILLPVLFVASIGALSLLGLLAYDEYTRVAPYYSAYPTAVEQRLRLALHYTHVSPDPDKATFYFTDAIKAAEGTGMDTFGKESMGIRIRFAEALENFGKVKAAVEVLDSIAKDCEEKLSTLAGYFSPSGDAASENGAYERSIQATEFRKALLKAIIQAKVKMSTLYESDYMRNLDLAKSTLSDAIGLLAKESKDPKVNAFSEGNAAGLTMEEISSLLSQMGDLYATTGEESNAVQVYLLALEPLRKACNGSRSCKEVQVFSNIAASMGLAMRKPGAQINGRPATKESMAAGRKAAIKWAEQAIATAAQVNDANREENCETALFSAQITRAELLLEGGDKIHSKKAFEGLLSSSRSRGLTELVQMAEDGLRRAS